MKRYLTQIVALLVLGLTVLLAAPAYAIDSNGDGIDDQTGARITITDPGAKEEACKGITGGTSTNCGDSGFFGNLVTTVVNVLTFVIGGIAVIMLIVGGIRYTVSGGDSNATKGAKDTILYAIIGIIIAASAQLIVRFVIGKI